MVKWLERLSHDAESHRFESWLGSASDQKTFSVNQAINGYLFRMSAKEGWGLPSVCCAQDTVGLKPQLTLGYGKP